MLNFLIVCRNAWVSGQLASRLEIDDACLGLEIKGLAGHGADKVEAGGTASDKPLRRYNDKHLKKSRIKLQPTKLALG